MKPHGYPEYNPDFWVSPERVAMTSTKLTLTMKETSE